MSSTPWDRAGALPVPYDGRPRPEIVALRPGSPDLADLFTFMRDAELRWDTLRLRIEERTTTTHGISLVDIDAVIRHPGRAKVTTSLPERGTAGQYEIWSSDGSIVQTYSAPHGLGTSRPVRPRVVGLDDRDFPGRSTVYTPLTALPADTLPEAFVHPAGYCQNVLSTGRCHVSGDDQVAGREAILVECVHPRAIERVADRPDFRISIAVDRETGVISRLVETIGGLETRRAEAVVLEPDGPLAPTAFDFTIPTGTTMLY
jgi:hypothetical protein